jgi:hypothetical protein
MISVNLLTLSYASEIFCLNPHNDSSAYHHNETVNTLSWASKVSQLDLDLANKVATLHVKIASSSSSQWSLLQDDQVLDGKELISHALLPCNITEILGN